MVADAQEAHANDAGADVFSPRDAVIRPGEICKIPLGFGLLVPDGIAASYFQKRIKRTGNCV